MAWAPLAVTTALTLAWVKGTSPLVAEGGYLLQWKGAQGRAGHAEPTGAASVRALQAVARALMFHEGASPHADARVPTCALQHRVRIIVASPTSVLETMRLTIDLAGSWALRRLLRSAGRLCPALGSFLDLVHLVFALIIVHALVTTRCFHWPAVLHHHSPGWLRDGEAHTVRAASPLADWELARPVTTARPSPFPSTATSPFVLITALGMRTALP